MQECCARNERARCGLWLAALGLGLALTATSRGQAMRDLVEAALDEQITQRIEIPEQPIRDALAELEKRTGLHFELHPMAVDWMPYGEQTRLSIVIQDMSVRRALERIFGGLGLAMRVTDDRVLVHPGPVLDRLGRRLSIDEVGLLQKLASQPWSALKPDDFAVEFRIPPDKDDPQQVFEQAMREGPAVDALTQLETATQRLGWLWVPAGKTIVVYSRTEDIQRRLDRPLDLNYQRVPLDKLLVDLGQRIGITIHFEPGALQKVAARDRHIDLIQRGTTVRQVLELITGNTGLWYDVVDDGVVVGAKPAAGPGSEPAGEQPQRVVAILRVPVGTDGTTIDFLIRADELPPEFKSLRDRKMPQVIEELRKQAQ
jgi:hypothetical protein